MKYYSTILLENQLNYLMRKYGEKVGPEIIQRAIDIDPRLAEKIVFSIANDIIKIEDLDASDLREKVAEVDPFKKVVQKTEGHLKYEALQKKAREISVPYYQWIIKVWKENGEDFPIDTNIFDYFDQNDYTNEDIKNTSYAEAQSASEAWHQDLAKKTLKYGSLRHGIDTQGTIEIMGYYFVPVHVEDAEIEGRLMQNCVSAYMVKWPEKGIISMRNKHNHPLVDFRIEDSRTRISEIKGRQNRPPVARYQLPVIEFVKRSRASISGTGINDFATIIMQYNPSLINELLDYFGKWDITIHNQFAPYLTQENADIKVAKLIKDSPKNLQQLNLNNISESLALLIFDTLKHSSNKADVYQKLLANRDNTKNITQEQWFSLAEGDFACEALYNCTFNETKAIDDLISIPPSEFKFLIGRFGPILKNLKGTDPRFTKHAIAFFGHRAEQYNEYGSSESEGQYELPMALAAPPEEFTNLYLMLPTSRIYKTFIHSRFTDLRNNPILLDKLKKVGISNIINNLFMFDTPQAGKFPNQIVKDSNNSENPVTWMSRLGTDVWHIAFKNLLMLMDESEIVELITSIMKNPNHKLNDLNPNEASYNQIIRVRNSLMNIYDTVKGDTADVSVFLTSDIAQNTGSIDILKNIAEGPDENAALIARRRLRRLSRVMKPHAGA